MILIDMRYVLHKQQYNGGYSEFWDLYHKTQKARGRTPENPDRCICVYYTIDAMFARFPHMQFSTEEMELDDAVWQSYDELKNDPRVEAVLTEQYIFGDVVMALRDRMVEDMNDGILLVSSKMRVLQLLCPEQYGIALFLDDRIYTSEDAENEYGDIDFRQFRILVGDRKFLPGVKGIGEKTAVVLLSDYGGVYTILRNFDHLQKGVQKHFLAVSQQDLMHYSEWSLYTPADLSEHQPKVVTAGLELRKKLSIMEHDNLVFFDLETTGTDVTTDKIVQISAALITNETVERLTYLIDPGIPISARASEVHGIYDADIVGKPTFVDIAAEVYVFFARARFWSGYNSDNYDIQILLREMENARRWGAFNHDPDAYDFEGLLSNVHLIDVLKLERLMNSHRLEDTYTRYYGAPFENAHNADADVFATIQVLSAQLATYQALPRVATDLAELSRGDAVDIAGKLVRDGDTVVFNFGPKRGEPVKNHPGLVDWMEKKGFPKDTLAHARASIQGN